MASSSLLLSLPFFLPFPLRPHTNTRAPHLTRCSSLFLSLSKSVDCLSTQNSSCYDREEVLWFQEKHRWIREEHRWLLEEQPKSNISTQIYYFYLQRYLCRRHFPFGIVTGFKNDNSQSDLNGIHRNSTVSRLFLKMKYLVWWVVERDGHANGGQRPEMTWTAIVVDGDRWYGNRRWCLRWR